MSRDGPVFVYGRTYGVWRRGALYTLAMVGSLFTPVTVLLFICLVLMCFQGTHQAIHVQRGHRSAILDMCGLCGLGCICLHSSTIDSQAINSAIQDLSE